MTDHLTHLGADLTEEQRQLLELRLRRATRSDESLPLSFTQEQLWFLDRLDPGNPAYNIPFGLRMTGPLDRAALRAAIDAVIIRHPALRTTFAQQADGELRQRVHHGPHPTLEISDLTGLPADQRAATADRVAVEHARQVFDLAAGPLVAVRLVVLGPDEHLLLVTAHHIVFDASSAGVFSRGLVAHYGGATLPALTTSFARHAAAERKRLTGPVLDAHLAHWRTALADAPVLSSLPTDHPRPPVQTHRGGRRELAVPAELTSALAERARRAGVTLNALVLTGFAALLGRATGQERVLLGMPVAGRPRTELESVIGSFANMLVLPVDVPRDRTFAELARGTHRTISEAHAHQDAPYARVVEAVDPPRDPSHNPLFQAMLSLTDGVAEQHEARGVRFTGEQVDSGLSDFDIFVVLSRVDGELRGDLGYNADLYLAETIDELAEEFLAVLAALADDPDGVPRDVPALRRQRVVVASSFTSGPLREPLEALLGVLHQPVDVELAPYHQVVQHLLGAGEERLLDVVLLRWSDWQRHADSPADALDEVWQDLETAIAAHAERGAQPLSIVVCPESQWSPHFARLDDRLAALAARLDGVHPVWFTDWADRYPVGVVFDAQTDKLGHIPYTPEMFAALALLVGRQLYRITGRTVDRVGFDPAALPELPALLPPWVRAVPIGEAELVLSAEPGVPGAVVVTGAPADFVAHLWPLDLPADHQVTTELGPQRLAHIATALTTPSVLADRAKPARVAAPADAPPLAPRTRTEERLVDLWQHVLGLAEVGVRHDFFTLGGHSLLATQLLSRVHAEFGADVSLHALFTHPTVESLAALLDEDEAATGRPIVPVARTGDLVPSSTQQRLWALGQLDGDPTRHNTTFAAVLRGELDATALRRAVDEVVRRHEVLRTTFVERDGRPSMVVHERLDCWLPEDDLSDESAADRAVEVRQQVRKHAKHHYDLETGPLLRVRLLRTGDAEHHLLLGMHHIVCDNTSWGVLLSELSAAYEAFAADRESPLLPLPVQFADYAAWQHDLLADAALEPHVEYWRDRLRGAPALLDLPTDRERPRQRTDRAGRAKSRVPATTGAVLREIARAEGTTPFAALLAVYATALHRRSGQTDVVIGVPQAGRTRPELDSLIGCFTDLLPVRVDLGGRPTFRQVAQRAHRAAVEGYQHQDVPFATMVEALALPRTAAHHPVFQCAFNLADLPDEATNWAGLELTPLDVPGTGIDFDLFLNLSWAGDELEVVLEYSADLFTQQGADDLLGDFVAELADLVGRPDAPIITAGQATTGVPVRVASSFPAEDLLPVLEWWSRKLRVPFAPVFSTPGQVLRPLLDPMVGVDAVLLRWQDLLPAEPRLGAVVDLDARLTELCRALDGRSGPLALIVCPPSGTFAEAPWTGIFGHATDRLRRSYPDIAVHDDVDDLGTLLARLAHQRIARPVSTVVVDPAGLDGTDELAVFVRAQREKGREVLLAADGDVTFPGLRTPGALAHLWPLDAVGAGDYVMAPELAVEIAEQLRTAADVRAAMTGAPVEVAATVKQAPRTERERALAALWQDLLKVAVIGVHDDFFDIGGDSMTAIQAVSVARRAGFAFTPRQLVANPTIAELCAALGEEPEPVADQGPVDGDLPPTGAQRWFFDVLAPTMSDPAHFNHPYYLSLRKPVPVAHLERAVRALAAHHDSLRLRFADRVRAWHAPVDGAVLVRSHDVSAVPSDQREAAIEAIIDGHQASLDLGGPLALFVHFGLGGAEPDRVLILCHHLVTDGVSRNLLLEDFQLALGQLADGQDPVFPPKTTSYRDWARKLDEYARGEQVAAELPFWLAQSPGAERIPVDLPGTSTFGDLDTVGTLLDAELTGSLRDLARAQRVSLSDLLVWASVRMVADWTGSPEWTIATTGHGREALFDDVDLSRTLGWFQVLYPVRLRLPDGTDTEAVKAIAAQLGQVPGGGLGHGLLRDGHPELAAASPQLTVNYMGAFGFEDVSSADEFFDLCHGPLGRVQDPGGVWPSRLDVVGTLIGDSLRVDLNYGVRVHRPDTAERLLGDLVGSLRRLVDSTTKKG
ncbi:MAG: condensation domain-containing protein [Umezawaea sp.]